MSSNGVIKSFAAQGGKIKEKQLAQALDHRLSKIP